MFGIKKIKKDLSKALDDINILRKEAFEHNCMISALLAKNLSDTTKDKDKATVVFCLNDKKRQRVEEILRKILSLNEDEPLINNGNKIFISEKKPINQIHAEQLIKDIIEKNKDE